MKEIQLTQGKVAFVDDEDYERLNRFKWYAVRAKDRFYAERKSASIQIRMHRTIMNAPKGIQVDHKDRNGLNNQKFNLRLATNQENCFNQIHPHKNNKLGVKGVHWREDTKKFLAQIQFNKKRIYLGLFTMLEDADSAYRKAEKKYFGEFARTQ